MTTEERLDTLESEISALRKWSSKTSIVVVFTLGVAISGGLPGFMRAIDRIFG